MELCRKFYLSTTQVLYILGGLLNNHALNEFVPFSVFVDRSTVDLEQIVILWHWWCKVWVVLQMCDI
ncbi:hypothetical protein CsSME_00000783 [Camellia sinensis var. sinensis]